jgi:hypothetical protein
VDHRRERDAGVGHAPGNDDVRAHRERLRDRRRGNSGR